ncbi:MAG: hypothetical protein ACQEW8_07150 [Actinomycetota bacterium]
MSESDVVNAVRLHPRALERLRARSGRTATEVLHDAGMSAVHFRGRLQQGAFNRAEIQRLAHALGVTTQELITTAKVMYVSEYLASQRDEAAPALHSAPWH